MTILIVGGSGLLGRELVRQSVAAGRAAEMALKAIAPTAVHVADLAAALLELAESDHAGVHHVAGPDAVSRYELGTLIAARDGLDASALPAGRRDEGPVDIRLDCTMTRQRLRTKLRGARHFLSND